MDFGERIRSLRLSADMSLRELDALAGLHAGHTRQIENGTGKKVAADTLKKIRAVFGVSFAWLLEGEGPQPNARKVADSVASARARRLPKVANG